MFVFLVSLISSYMLVYDIHLELEEEEEEEEKEEKKHELDIIMRK